MHRSGKEGILTTLTNACTLLALNASCLGFYKDHNQIELAYVFESAYFLLIFSFHLLDKLVHANHDPYSSQRGSYAMFASILRIWLRQIMHNTKRYALELQICNMTLLPKCLCLRNALQYVLFLMLKELRH